jgi:hypothetical protein
MWWVPQAKPVRPKDRAISALSSLTVSKATGMGNSAAGSPFVSFCVLRLITYLIAPRVASPIGWRRSKSYQLRLNTLCFPLFSFPASGWERPNGCSASLFSFPASGWERPFSSLPCSRSQPQAGNAPMEALPRFKGREEDRASRPPLRGKRRQSLQTPVPRRSLGTRERPHKKKK